MKPGRRVQAMTKHTVQFTNAHLQGHNIETSNVIKVSLNNLKFPKHALFTFERLGRRQKRTFCFNG